MNRIWLLILSLVLLVGTVPQGMAQSTADLPQTDGTAVTPATGPGSSFTCPAAPGMNRAGARQFRQRRNAKSTLASSSSNAPTKPGLTDCPGKGQGRGYGDGTQPRPRDGTGFGAKHGGRKGGAGQGQGMRRNSEGGNRGKGMRKGSGGGKRLRDGSCGSTQ